MANISLGPKLNKLINANRQDDYTDAFRPFLRAFDQLVMPTVIGASLSAPPSNPNNGDAYIVPVGATGLWVGMDNQLATYSAEVTSVGSNVKIPGWEFYFPQEGWVVWNQSTKTSVRFTSGSWTSAKDGYADGEVPTGVINGTNVTFSLAHSPNPPSSCKLYFNGQRLNYGPDFTSASTDFTLSGTTITLRNAPPALTALVADYRY